LITPSFLEILELIAFEKAGIIKPNVPVIIGEYTSETKAVFLTKAKEGNSRFICL
jgi:dihydrofolate synthase/folylpolyglutamate synthase